MPRFSTPLLAPRHWLSWIAVFCLKLLIQLPYRWLMRIGRSVGSLLRIIIKNRYRVADINLSLCFPELSLTERQALIRKTFKANGQGFMEAAFAWWASRQRFDKIPHKITGLELLQPDRLTQGVLLLFPHLTTLEITGRIVSQKVPLSVVYQSQSNAVFDWLIYQARQRYYNTVFNRRQLRQIITALQQKQVVVYLPDQDFGYENSVFAPFFNVLTSTTTATARLAKIANARIVLGSCVRRENDHGYDIIFSEFPHNFPNGDDAQDATVINAHIEQAINRDRSNYLWLHRRFKTRPAGEQSVYIHSG